MGTENACIRSVKIQLKTAGTLSEIGLTKLEIGLWFTELFLYKIIRQILYHSMCKHGTLRLGL